MILNFAPTVVLGEKLAENSNQWVETFKVKVIYSILKGVRKNFLINFILKLLLWFILICSWCNNNKYFARFICLIEYTMQLQILIKLQNFC